MISTMSSKVLICFGLLLLLRRTEARQDRTSEPTPSPFDSQAPTSIPSIVPTPLSTPQPTFAPTPVPTGLPTGIPTTSPTLVPTGRPTVPPTRGPTPLPTVQPTRGPTPVPTFRPTRLDNTPTFSPSMSPSVFKTSTPSMGGTVSRALPNMLIAFTSSRAISQQDMQTQLNAFLGQVLSTKTNPDDFKSLQAIYSFINYRNTSGSILITGETLLDDEDPSTEEELTRELIAYFNFFGWEDLEKALVNAGYPDASVQVTVNGITRSSPSPQPEDDGTDIGIIVGAILGGIALCCLCVILVFLLAAKREKEEPEKPVVGVDVAKEGPSVPAIPQEIDMEEASAAESTLAAMSAIVDGNRNSSFQYDVSRLDQVIDSAKGFAKAKEQEEKQKKLSMEDLISL